MNVIRKKYAYRQPYRRGRTAATKAVANYRTGGYMGAEIKFLDNALNGSIISNLPNLSDGLQDPANIDCLNAPDQGSGPQNREGRKIFMKSIHISGSVIFVPQFDNTVVPTIPDVYLALVLDTQTNKTQMSSGDCFTNPGGTSDTITCPFRDLEYTSRFKVLKKWHMRGPDLDLDVTGATTHETIGKVCHFEMHRKLYNIPVTFVGNAVPNTVGNIMDNSLHLVAFCNGATDGDDQTAIQVNLSYNARLRFSDP